MFLCQCFNYSTYGELLFNYSEASWKRPDTGECVSGYDREDVFRPVESAQVESEPNFPKPAEGKKEIVNACM